MHNEPRRMERLLPDPHTGVAAQIKAACDNINLVIAQGSTPPPSDICATLAALAAGLDLAGYDDRAKYRKRVAAELANCPLDKLRQYAAELGSSQALHRREHALEAIADIYINNSRRETVGNFATSQVTTRPSVAPRTARPTPTAPKARKPKKNRKGMHPVTKGLLITGAAITSPLWIHLAPLALILSNDPRKRESGRNLMMFSMMTDMNKTAHNTAPAPVKPQPMDPKYLS